MEEEVVKVVQEKMEVKERAEENDSSKCVKLRKYQQKKPHKNELYLHSHTLHMNSFSSSDSFLHRLLLPSTLLLPFLSAFSLATDAVAALEVAVGRLVVRGRGRGGSGVSCKAEARVGEGALHASIGRGSGGRGK